MITKTSAATPHAPGFGHRIFMKLGTALTAAFLIISAAAHAQAPGITINGETTMKKIQFKNAAINMAGNLYLPEGFEEGKKYEAVVVVHPGGGVKEQTAGLYAEKLAAQGFVALAFDASHQGESGGEPRFLENPAERVEDIRSAVDYLTTLSYVNAEAIGTLGICAGSGYAIKAASTDHRIKAAATVSAVDIGTGARKGWDGKAPVADQIATLKAVAVQRTAEAAGAAPKYVTYVPEIFDASTPNDLREAYTYYRTPEGRMHPNSPNKMLFVSLDKMLAFTAFDQVETLLTQPILVIAGSKAGSLWHSEELHAKAKGKKELVIIEGATHMDLYDGEHADQAVAKLIPFFKGNL